MRKVPGPHKVFALLFACFFDCQVATAAERLPAYAADVSRTSVSGVSSGGYMAVQFHVAHSAIVVGAGVLAGGPYYCAQGSLWTALCRCMRRQSPTSVTDLATLKTAADALEKAGKIDSTMNLANSRLWVLSGSKDEFVKPPVAVALRDFYAAYLDPARIRHVDTIPAAHAMVTRDFGGTCGAMESPYINNCGFDAAGELLTHIYGQLRAPVTKEQGSLLAFDQSEFLKGNAYRHSMANEGYVYVPRRCTRNACPVHVVFHGCRQNVETIGEVFVRHTGYNRWADSNDLIVLYPQTIARFGWSPSRHAGFVFNPMGCWDWWGYDSPEYHTRAGPQIEAVRAMLERLASAK